MAILESHLKMRTVGELFEGLGDTLCVPRYQRRYSWKPHNATELFDDVLEACETQRTNERKEDYVLGTVILYGADGSQQEPPTSLQIVDGQQRILTLRLLRAMLAGTPIRFPEANKTSPLIQVNAKLAERVNGLRATDEELHDAVARYLDEHCTILTVVTDDEDEAFQFFDSQNYRGKSLRPHDLLKAYHLREMRNVPRDQQAEVVQEWEAAGEATLDELFSTVLVRILRWSRGRRSLGFSQDDIGMFKGLSTGGAATPSGDYHRAAQTLLPGLHAWEGTHYDEPVVKHQRRSRYQLDAPLLAGRHFFDMVAFMLGEIRELADQFTAADGDPSLGPFWHDEENPNHRYRYCQELLLCGALYYTNKFGEGTDFASVRRSLITWAYSPRLIYSRISWRSIDTYALGDNPRLNDLKGVQHANLFAHIRDATTRQDLELEDIRLPEPDQRREMADRESELVAALEGGHDERGNQ